MGCCCSKSPSLQSLGRQVECPRCGRVFSAATTNYSFNEHLDSCLQSSQVPQVYPEDYRGILYWEKILEEGKYRWVQRVYNPNLQINEANITKEPFGQKQIWFRAKLEKLRIPWQNGCTTLLISQTKLLESSIEQILKLKPKLLHGEVKIKFQEDTLVQDAGGLLREWSTCILKEVVKLGYLQQTYTDEVTYRLNPNPTGDGGNPHFERRKLFTFLGILVGKCLFERIPIGCYLDRTLIKQVLGQKVSMADMLYYDQELYHSWQYMIKNEFDESMCLNFTLEHNGQQVNLKSNGENIKVNQSNLKEFVDLCVSFYATKSLEPYLQEFLTGLYQVIPKFLLVIFQAEELEMMLFGLPFISLADWQANTVYKDCSPDDIHITWFWEVLGEWDQEQLKSFLRFCTGSTRVPVEGFSKLEGNRGEIAIFCVQGARFIPENPYPKAHTCFNRLELPEYPTRELMSEYMSATLSEQLEGQFGLE